MLSQDAFSCSYTTPYHRVANAANAFDLDFHDIPVMQKERGSAFEPHSRWRPCRDDIAWLQGHEGTEESDRRGHRKDHIGGRVMLYHLLIHPGGERERLGIGNAGCQDDPWSHRRKGIQGFASRPLTDRKSTRLNSSHSQISYAVFCLKKKKTHIHITVHIFRNIASIHYLDIRSTGHLELSGHGSART